MGLKALVTGLVVRAAVAAAVVELVGLMGALPMVLRSSSTEGCEEGRARFPGRSLDEAKEGEVGEVTAEDAEEEEEEEEEEEDEGEEEAARFPPGGATTWTSSSPPSSKRSMTLSVRTLEWASVEVGEDDEGAAVATMFAAAGASSSEDESTVGSRRI
jgi:hypothetical protein